MALMENPSAAEPSVAMDTAHEEVSRFLHTFTRAGESLHVPLNSQGDLRVVTYTEGFVSGVAQPQPALQRTQSQTDRFSGLPTDPKLKLSRKELIPSCARLLRRLNPCLSSGERRPPCAPAPTAARAPLPQTRPQRGHRSEWWPGHQPAGGRRVVCWAGSCCPL